MAQPRGPEQRWNHPSPLIRYVLFVVCIRHPTTSTRLTLRHVGRLTVDCEAEKPPGLMVTGVPHPTGVDLRIEVCGVSWVL